MSLGRLPRAHVIGYSWSGKPITGGQPRAWLRDLVRLHSVQAPVTSDPRPLPWSACYGAPPSRWREGTTSRGGPLVLLSSVWSPVPDIVGSPWGKP
jgi:hypothetical protein